MNSLPANLKKISLGVHTLADYDYDQTTSVPSYWDLHKSIFNTYFPAWVRLYREENPDKYTPEVYDLAEETARRWVSEKYAGTNWSTLISTTAGALGNWSVGGFGNLIAVYDGGAHTNYSILTNAYTLYPENVHVGNSYYGVVQYPTTDTNFIKMAKGIFLGTYNMGNWAQKIS